MERNFLIEQINKYNEGNKQLLKDLGKYIQKLGKVIDFLEKIHLDNPDIEIINELQNILGVMNRAQKLVGSKEIAIQLGKETLLFILSQKNCEGIRFYFCESPYGNTSVAAVGVREFKGEDGQTQQVPHPRDPYRLITVGQDIGVCDGFLSIIGAPANSMDPVILNGEVGPPYRTRQLLGQSLLEEDLEDEFISLLRDVYQ